MTRQQTMLAAAEAHLGTMFAIDTGRDDAPLRVRLEAHPRGPVLARVLGLGGDPASAVVLAATVRLLAMHLSERFEVRFPDDDPCAVQVIRGKPANLRTLVPAGAHAYFPVPVTVVVAPAEGGAVAVAPLFDLRGDGPNEAAAIADLRRRVAHAYLTDPLAPGPRPRPQRDEPSCPPLALHRQVRAAAAPLSLN